MAADLQGKVALVTGGSSGFGKLTAQRFAARGATVVVADVAVEAGRAVADAVDGRFVALDVSDSARWGTGLDEALGSDGTLDVACLNAGIGTNNADLLNISDEEYRRVVGVNLDGVFFGARAAVRRMRSGGAIVATASLGGLVPMPNDPVYSLTKHAVVAFVRSIAPGLTDRRITVNAVCPGFADTPLLTDDFRAALAAADLPLIDPEVVADTVMRILDEGRTGEAWFVQPGREPAPYEFRGVPGPR
ncbi:MAG: SDR family oxidoreductase [Nitriliruptorales bacterium]|nr:SDR family oxidoreductase [Nitriliruptorales bacterium]